jgi:hypothetical protein
MPEAMLSEAMTDNAKESHDAWRERRRPEIRGA